MCGRSVNFLYDRARRCALPYEADRRALARLPLTRLWIDVATRGVWSPAYSGRPTPLSRLRASPAPTPALRDQRNVAASVILNDDSSDAFVAVPGSNSSTQAKTSLSWVLAIIAASSRIITLISRQISA